MNLLRKILLFPFGILYGTILQFRNILYDIGAFPTTKPFKPSISVGNLAVGGTGKTPAIKFLLEKLGSNGTTVISRGYGRKSKGLQTVEIDDQASKTGDEPLEIKIAFPQAQVLVSEKRTHAIASLKDQEKISLFLFDDLFQHRSVQVDCSILLSTYKKPFYNDTVLPAGNLREFSYNKNRANILLITKCPKNLTQNEADKIKAKANVKVPVFFASQSYSKAHWLQANKATKKVIAIASIAQPEYFFEECKNQFQVTKTKAFPDHYSYTKRDIEELIGLANNTQSDILTTAKDMSKLHTFASLFNDINLGSIPMKMEVLFQEENEYLSCIKKNIQ